MRVLSRVLFVAIPIAILLFPTPAFATAWGAWKYELTVPSGYGGFADYCLRAGVVDTASNRVDMQTHTDTASCSGAAQNVPGGYLGGRVAGYRDGNYCGTSATAYSSSATWGYAVYANMCSNPSGLQTFYTIGTGAIYDDGSAGGSPGYAEFSRTSPNQSY